MRYNLRHRRAYRRAFIEIGRGKTLPFKRGFPAPNFYKCQTNAEAPQASTVLACMNPLISLDLAHWLVLC